jgi:holo-[acyl-carrier protein] synthase
MHGIDIVKVCRIESAINDSENFLSKVFTAQEIEYCECKHNKFESYAARYAAKEATMKAFGIGWGQGIDWKDIEVSNDDNGKPFLTLYGTAKHLFVYSKFHGIHVSLSHTDDMAMASVILL